LGDSIDERRRVVVPALLCPFFELATEVGELLRTKGLAVRLERVRCAA
jgi:hypothetical protein